MVKLNGCLSEPETIVIAASDFQRFQSARRNLVDGLRADLKRHEVLYVGVSFDDPWQKLLRDTTRDDLGEATRPRYLMACRPTDLERRVQRDLGLELVGLQDWSELATFLQRLHGRTDELRSQEEHDGRTETIALRAEVAELRASKWKTALDRIAQKANSGLLTEAAADIEGMLSRMTTDTTTAPSPKTTAAARRTGRRPLGCWSRPSRRIPASQIPRLTEGRVPNSLLRAAILRQHWEP